MTTSKFDLDSTDNNGLVYIPKKIGFYRPHKPVDTDDLVADPKTGKLSKMPSMARQEFRDQCDINNILKQFKKTGIISHINAQREQGSYEDLPDPMEYQDALNAVLEAQEAFSTLPSKVRTRFDNDPAKFLEFMSDPRNQEEAYDLGLAERPVAQVVESNQLAARSAASGGGATPSTPPASKPSSEGS